MIVFLKSQIKNSYLYSSKVKFEKIFIHKSFASIVLFGHLKDSLSIGYTPFTLNVRILVVGSVLSCEFSIK